MWLSIGDLAVRCLGPKALFLSLPTLPTRSRQPMAAGRARHGKHVV